MQKIGRAVVNFLYKLENSSSALSSTASAVLSPISLLVHFQKILCGLDKGRE
jgi:hypothetical protein